MILNTGNFLIYLEPIGGSKPKFSQKSESLTFTEKAQQTLSLLCPAMGSPLPSFRFVKGKHTGANENKILLSRIYNPTKYLSVA